MSTEDHPDWWRPMGGQNSQDSILERRSLIWNDNEVEAPDAPPANYTEIIDKGKFYPRGCRGMLEQLQIYCIRTGVGTLTLRYSPHPCLGQIGAVVITPGATWAWVAADIEEMWDYDSLFIWVSACSVDVSWAYDAVPPYDGHWSQDAWITWEDMAIRPFIRAVYTGETPGDVPVSGIINNIQIPNTSSHLVGTNIDIVTPAVTVCNTIRGIGFVDLLILAVMLQANSHATGFRVYCDDVLAWEWAFIDMNNWGFARDTQPMALVDYAADGWCTMMITKKFEFRRVFRLDAYNNVANARVYTRLYPNLLR